MLLRMKMCRALTGQRGVVLITVAVLLVVLGSLGVAAMRSANIQERMAGVFYDRAVAMHASDAALSDGFQYLLRPDFSSSASTSKVRDGLALFTSSTADGLTGKSWVQNNSNWLSGLDVLRLGEADGNTSGLLRVKDNPGYVIDRMPNMGASTTSTFENYRVTARGGGGRAESSVYTHYLVQVKISSGS